MSIVRNNDREPLVRRVAQAIITYIGFGEEPSPVVITVPSRPTLQLVPRAEAHSPRSLNRTRTDHSSHQNLHTRTARHNAVRGLTSARSGDLEGSRRYWRSAVLAERIDLSALPGFWELTRRQMMVAVDAYEQAGKYQESAVLEEQIASVCRPRLVGSSLTPAQPRLQDRRAVNN